MDLIIRLKNVWLNAYKYVSRVVGEFKLIRFYLYGKIFMFVKGEKFKVTKPDKKNTTKSSWLCANRPTRNIQLELCKCSGLHRYWRLVLWYFSRFQFFDKLQLITLLEVVL